MTAQARLTLDDPTRPVPLRPTLFHVVGRETVTEPFDTVAQLAARVAALFGPGVAVAATVSQSAYPGLELFPAWGLYAGPERQWIGHAAIQTTPRDTLVAALAAPAERVAA